MTQKKRNQLFNTSDKMLLVQSLNSVKFEKLAIFICHLLVGGKFQAVQIIHDSGTFNNNNQLIHDLKSRCLDEIPWTILDTSYFEIPQWIITIKTRSLCSIDSCKP